MQPVFVADKIDYRLHEYLRGIDLNTLITMVEKEDKCRETDMFLKPGELEAKFVKYAFILDNTRRLMDNCMMDYPDGKDQVEPKDLLPGIKRMTRLCWRSWRWKGCSIGMVAKTGKP